MTILCSGDCHVWLGSSSLCTCEVYRVAMYGFPANYGVARRGHNPFAPSKSTPPTLRPGSGCTAADLPDVPASRLGAAQDAGAGWLSADGLIAYTVRYGRVLQADWDGARFGGWLDIGEEMPADAVKM